jgi:hypothetical protein
MAAGQLGFQSPTASNINGYNNRRRFVYVLVMIAPNLTLGSPVTDNTVQRRARISVSATVTSTILASAIAALLGVAAGVAMAHVAPNVKFSWAGLAVAPLWFLLEIVFELFVGVFGSYSRVARIVVTTSLLLGFYIAWFAARPL